MPYGMKSKLGIAFQNSLGTVANNSSLHWIPYLTEGVTRKQPGLRAEGMRGILDHGLRHTGPGAADGEIEIEAQAIPLGAFFAATLEPISSVVSGSIYTHTFRPRTTDQQDLSAEKPVTLYKDLDDAGNPNILYDLGGTLLEMSVTQSELLKAKLGLIGGQRTTATSVAFTDPGGRTWGWNVSSVQLGGAAIADITEMTLSLANNLEGQYTLNNSREISRLKRTASRVLSINGTMKFENQDELAQFISESERQLIVHFEGITEIQSGFFETVTIDVPAFTYEAFDPAGDAPGQLEVSFSGFAEYHVGSGNIATLTLVNTLAAYY